MDYTQLKRDKARVFKALSVLPDHSVVAKESLEIHFPSRFIEKSFATIGRDVESIMVLGLVLPDGTFASILTQAEVTMSPTNIREQNIERTPYTILEFERGDTVFQNLTVVKNEHLNNPYYKEFTYYGRKPWYIDTEMLPAMFDHCRATTGRGVGSSPQVFRAIYGLCSRDPENIERAYRYSTAAQQNKPPVIVGLNNGSMLIDGTFNHLMGGYLTDNINEAILNPDTRVTEAEKIMKGSVD